MTKIDNLKTTCPCRSRIQRLHYPAFAAFFPSVSNFLGIQSANALVSGSGSEIPLIQDIEPSNSRARLSHPILRFFSLAEQCHTQHFYLRKKPDKEDSTRPDCACCLPLPLILSFQGTLHVYIFKKSKRFQIPQKNIKKKEDIRRIDACVTKNSKILNGFFNIYQIIPNKSVWWSSGWTFNRENITNLAQLSQS